MICSIVLCALLVGGNGRCDPAKTPELIDYPAITRAVDCQDFGRFIRSGGVPIPGNFRLMRTEMIEAPTVQIAQGDKR